MSIPTENSGINISINNQNVQKTQTVYVCEKEGRCKEDAIQWNPYNKCVQCHRCGAQHSLQSQIRKMFGYFFTLEGMSSITMPTKEINEAIDFWFPEAK